MSDFISALRGQIDVLPPGPRVLAAEIVKDVHRARIVAGMAEAASEKGYAATTIGDVVARAQVSRRTFYELFEDKDACFLATYDACADLLIEIITEAADAPGLTWSQRIEAGVAAYLGTLAKEAGLTRVFLVEILAAGPLALARRRVVHGRIADMVRALVEGHRGEFPPEWSLDEPMAIALIGAVNELVLLTLEEGGAVELPRIAETAGRLVRAVLAAGEPGPVPAPGPAPVTAPSDGADATA